MENTSSQQNEKGHNANMVLYAVAPQPKLSTDSNALDSVSELRGITVGADSDPIQMFNEDCLEGIKRIPDNSIDAIITDPPYLYLKGQKLERKFNEQLFFSECKRVLKKYGFIVLFGRGTSFYRWNTILYDLGLQFKEEIIWNKSYTTSSMHPISRCHESITLWSIKGKINEVRLNYLEQKPDLISIHQDLKRIKSALNSPKEILHIEKYLAERIVDFGEEKKRGYNTTIQGVTKEQCRSVKTLQAIVEGMKEKSIIKVNREHYKTIHPTQKPVKLIDRLLKLVSKEGDTILDPFAGSFSCAEACNNSVRRFIGFEIDKEYFDAGKKRINNLEPNLFNK